MWEKYINYNKVAEEMIRRHEDNVAALESLREQLEEMGDGDGLRAIQYDADPVQTSPTADALVNRVIQRESVRGKVEELEKENQRFARAWERLTDKERQILETFFARGLRSRDAVDVITNQFGCGGLPPLNGRTKPFRDSRDFLLDKSD